MGTIIPWFAVHLSVFFPALVSSQWRRWTAPWNSTDIIHRACNHSSDCILLKDNVHYYHLWIIQNKPDSSKDMKFRNKVPRYSLEALILAYLRWVHLYRCVCSRMFRYDRGHGHKRMLQLLDTGSSMVTHSPIHLSDSISLSSRSFTHVNSVFTRFPPRESGKRLCGHYVVMRMIPVLSNQSIYNWCCLGFLPDLTSLNDRSETND